MSKATRSTRPRRRWSSQRDQRRGRRRPLLLEPLEARCLLAAVPLSIGVVYVEEDLGSDIHGDRFEITFRGGAAGSQLQKLIINGDQSAPGFGVGDVFFDTADGNLGADNSFPFTLISLHAQHPDASVRATVVDGQSTLLLEFSNFRAGDKLVFSIDVDEVEDYDSAQTDLTILNDGFDPITSGVEFQGSKMQAWFTAPHYEPISVDTPFVNRYDNLLVGTQLDLPADDAGGKRDRSAAAVARAQQKIIPASISGFVYHDRNNDGQRGPGEEGIAGVQIQLIPTSTVEPQATVTLVTGSDGSYAFTGISPGSYRLVETQPSGYLDGRDSAGSIDGLAVSIESANDLFDQLVLAGGSQGVEFNFGELLPVSIAGHVAAGSRSGQCLPDSPPIAGVRLQLFDAQGLLVGQTVTAADGSFLFQDLRPGEYSVVEQTPEGWFDGPDSPGNVDGRVVGRLSGNDRVEQMVLLSGQQLKDLHFCELLPSEISGSTYHDRNDNGVRDAGEEGIGQVVIQLLDQNGQIVRTTTTDQNGIYRFNQLAAGSYAIVQQQPGAWIDGRDTLGTVAGIVSGRHLTNDRFEQIELLWGDRGQDYDFGELLPGTVSGRVHADRDSDCRFDEGEQPIAGVLIELLDAEGRIVASTRTDVDGRYQFVGLRPGTYAVREIQPAGFFQGGHRVGEITSPSDTIESILVASGQSLVDYDFCEIPPSSLAGQVHLDVIRNCVRDESESGLGGVSIQLLADDGSVVATQVTNAEGRYRFEGLAPGTYSVRQIQPAAYFDGGQRAGSAGGQTATANLIAEIAILAGSQLTEYDFCEVPPGRLSGFVFQDGDAFVTADGALPSDWTTQRDGRLTSDDRRLAGVVLELRDGLTGAPIDGSMALPGTYAAGPIRATTNAQGYYEFQGLAPGSYAVFEVQPQGWLDGIDTPGTTAGIAINPGQAISPLVLQTLVVNPGTDAILRIPVAAGGNSENNNFSELQVRQRILLPPDPLPEVPRFVVPPAVVVQSVPWNLGPRTSPSLPWMIPIYGSSAAGPFAWHLSVMGGGTPRGVQTNRQPVWQTAAHVSQERWLSLPLNQGRWQMNVVADAQHVVQESPITFGIIGGIPVSGDFNGDGIAEVGVYHRGQWFLDLNGNGQWDEGDLWANLGSASDLPVVGDWDGDGKDDIGIFGPQWIGDARAIALEPGLPDPENTARQQPKNPPPSDEQATSGQRTLKKSAGGQLRADVIDHVFAYGRSGDVPVAGDFNGDGIDTIGVFRNGLWVLDVDGDGRLGERDRSFTFGERGDLPVVGDFDGDGIDQVGVYRQGQWIIDSDANQRLDAHDQVFSMESGDAAVQPVVGDFNGDGVEDAAVYSWPRG